MAARYLSDTARANLASLVSAAIGAGATAGMLLPDGTAASTDIKTLLITFYLCMWPAFVIIYVAWTHVSYERRGPRTLEASARRETRSLQKWWAPMIGYGGASSWTLTGAVFAVFLTVVVAQTPVIHSSWLYIGLGMLSVASSWALMVYSFALQYLRLVASADGTENHISLEVEDPARFSDYLTLAILVSTMAATSSARIHTRKAWQVLRLNVVFAFVFNTVIVAMMVSLLFGSLTA
ncbi:DUF1345 domain-containing protein [Paramicrobacterium chengjingii]|uniref:DUF1345 domain-containing protein n=1 Tax=Paramicrobacterium chengjingii TaxID=2769067 RepID=A0ABX6YJS8_9MICO|nr:DUF1345 domain-containing protein [Microbacterium chengjingii]QPZ39012.1 DUF1345 domain-containing protein [Microbacterium chengjingii]